MSSLTRNRLINHSKLDTKFKEVDEHQFRDLLSSRGAEASTHIFTRGNLTVLADTSFCMTAVIQRPSPGPSQTDTNLVAQNVRYLLPNEADLKIPLSLSISFRAEQTIAKFCLSLVSLCRQALQTQKLKYSFSRYASKRISSRTLTPEWHTLQLTTSNLSS